MIGNLLPQLLFDISNVRETIASHSRKSRHFILEREARLALQNRNITMSTAVLAPPQSTGINQALTKLKELGINFLALDFDRTILDIHTGGRWNGSLEELYPHVRPIFAHLIEAAVQDDDIHVAVVTFTRQIQLVRGILDQIVGPEASQRIPIRGGDRSWRYSGGGSLQGKQPHMASAVEELESQHAGLQITRSTTLLIDDDQQNTRYALTHGVRAIWLNPEKPHLLLQNIRKLV